MVFTKHYSVRGTAGSRLNWYIYTSALSKFTNWWQAFFFKLILYIWTVFPKYCFKYEVCLRKEILSTIISIYEQQLHCYFHMMRLVVRLFTIIIFNYKINFN